MLAREPFGSRADEVHMWRVVEHQARGVNGVAQSLDAGDAAGAQVLSIHQQGVELHAPVSGKERPAPGVEGLIILHHGDGRFHRSHRRRACFKQRVARRKRVGDAPLMIGDCVVRHGPGSAVDDEGGSVHR